jgi:hypothetical protein
MLDTGQHGTSSAFRHRPDTFHSAASPALSET